MLEKRIRDLYRYRKVLWDMSAAQLKTKYAGSKLGIWWAVITPLLLALCINVIFTGAFKVAIPHYTLFVLAGIIPWLFFNAALAEATTSFITSSSVTKQTLFPRELIPFSSVISNLFNFLIGFVFLLPIFIFFDVRVVYGLATFVLIVVLHFFFVVGAGLLFACANVFVRDLSHFLSIGFMLWFWITPIFYSLDMIPFPFRWVCLFNPMTYYVVSYRQVLFEAKNPSLLTLIILFSLSIVFFLLGYLFFLKTEKMLLKRI